MFEIIFGSLLIYCVWQKHQRTGAIANWSWGKIILLPIGGYALAYLGIFMILMGSAFIAMGYEALLRF